MPDTYRYCPTCGGALETRLLKAGDPPRLVCTKCGFILYLDPKVAVGTIITAGLSRASAEAGESRGLSRASAEAGESRDRDNRIVLVRRAIEPGYGLWVFPGGYVDRGEEVTAAARREAREEAGLDVRLDGLVNIYSYPERPLIIIVYSATWIGGELCTDEESLEARLFSPEEIPWPELAFRSTHEALHDYLEGRVHLIR